MDLESVRRRARALLRRAGLYVNQPGSEMVERVLAGGGRVLYRYTTWIINVRIQAVIACTQSGCELLGASVREPHGARVWTPGEGWRDGDPTVEYTAESLSLAGGW